MRQTCIHFAHRMNRLALVFLACLLICGWNAPLSARAQSTAVVAIEPQTSVIAVGSSAAVYVQVQGVADLNAFDVSLTFNPALLTITMSRGGFLEGPGFTIISDTDGSDGTLRMAFTQTGSTPKSGTGNLLVLNVTSRQPGIHPITISGARLSGGTGEISETIPCSTRNGVVQSNAAPVAVNDSFSTAEDTAIVSTASVLANDNDLDGGPSALTAVLYNSPARGSVSLSANGLFTYTPNANINGTDSFQYRAYDGMAYSNVATVNISISPVPDAPVAVTDSYVTDEDTLLSVPASGVLANDYDVDGDALTAELVSDVSHGTLTLNANGSFNYQPAANYNGVDNFTYRAVDLMLNSNVVMVTININPVNDVPSAGNNNFNLSQGGTLTVPAPGVLNNDTDIDGDPLTAVKLTNPAHGTLTLNANGSFTYKPVASYYGTDQFTYCASDGVACSASATVFLNIAQVPATSTPRPTKTPTQTPTDVSHGLPTGEATPTETQVPEETPQPTSTEAPTQDPTVEPSATMQLQPTETSIAPTQAVVQPTPSGQTPGRTSWRPFSWMKMSWPPDTATLGTCLLPFTCLIGLLLLILIILYLRRRNKEESKSKQQQRR